MKTRDYFDTLYWLLINAFYVVDDPILHECAMQKYKEFIHSETRPTTVRRRPHNTEAR